MAERPCKPDDFKRLWRLLLPDAPLPGCGTPERKLTVVSDSGPKAERRRRNNAAAERPRDEDDR